MPDSRLESPLQLMPAKVAVIGAAGGLGQGILRVCRSAEVRFTAIVRSRPERITAIPEGSRVEVLSDLGDRARLADAFRDSDAVLTAMGVTRTSSDRTALLSKNLASVEAAMNSAGVDRILIINTLLAAAPGAPPSFLGRLFSLLPGNIGRGAAELQAVPAALGNGAFSSLRWTLVRAATNAKGKDVPPAAALSQHEAVTSMWPVSYDAMARWMLEEAAANRFVREAPLVSRPR